MFSVRQKREIAEKVQQILRETGHMERFYSICILLVQHPGRGQTSGTMAP